MSVEIREHLVGTPQSGCWAEAWSSGLAASALPTEASCWPLLFLLCVKSAVSLLAINTMASKLVHKLFLVLIFLGVFFLFVGLVLFS